LFFKVIDFLYILEFNFIFYDLRNRSKKWKN